MDSIDDFLRHLESVEDREKAEEIQRDAEEICGMILNQNYPDVDIEIAMKQLKSKVEKLFPDKKDLYSMIYESRFKRFWEQFRK